MVIFFRKCLLTLVCVLGLNTGIWAQSAASGEIVGTPMQGAMGITETVDQIMARDPGVSPFPSVFMIGPEHEVEYRKHLPPNPFALPGSQYPPALNSNTRGQFSRGNATPHLPLILGTSFLGGNLGLSSAVPPDTQMAVGPTQILMCINGRIRVFDKSGALGPLNTTTDSFFNSVRNGAGTSDPRVRYDRALNRWFVIIINTPATSNRVLLAVSSGPTITGAGSFTFFQFQFDTFGGGGAGDAGQFFDYPSLGLDEDALYIGGIVFGSPWTTVFVVQKASILGAGPIVATAFRNIGNGSVEGPFAAQGVSNDLAGTNEGYFIGVSSTAFSKLIVRRVSNPGGVPTLSGNLPITVNATVYPMNVSTPLSGTPLDAIDDRLMEAFLRKNRYTGNLSLWTCHHIEVDTTGAANGAGNRNGTRWYELNNLSTTPALVQSGTVWDSAASNPLSYWFSGINATGQGYMAMAPCRAGLVTRPEIATMGRFYTDMTGQVVTPYTLVQSSAAVGYGPFTSPDRWGDYATVSLDPSDDQTLWGSQEYVDAANSWGVRIFQLKAPAPTVTSCSPNSLAQGATANVVVTGTGLYDTEAGINRLVAAFSGTLITVNSVTLNSITQATLNVTVNAAATTGLRNLTLTNPDGQSATGVGVFTVTGGSNPVPTLTLISPSSATAGGAGFTITCTGTNFISGSIVRWNGSDRVTTFGSSTSITAAITAADIATAGTATVTVFNPAPGGGTSSGLTFTINNPVPTLTLISPNSATAGGAGFTITCTGTNFNAQSKVRWNGSDRVTTFGTSTSITAAITAADIATAGTATVTVFNPAPGGGTSSGLTFTINNPVPTLTLISPNSATAGGAGFTITCTGTNFVAGSIVRWNGSDRVTTFGSSTSITAAITAADIATAGTATVTVFNPTPGGGTSSGLTFTINNPVPTLTLISPNSATAGGAGFTITCTGTNFNAQSKVRWNGSDRVTTFGTSTSITAAITAADIATAGTATVTVFNPTPGGGTSSGLTFTINNPVPTLTLISPNSATAGGAGFTITCTGTNFNAQSKVRWNGSDRVTTFVNSTSITAAITAADIATAGTATVTVFNPTPGGGTSSGLTFTINNPVPTLSLISPNSATAGGAGFTITCTGTNYNSQSIVRWNGSNRTTTFVNATTVTAAINASDIAVAGSATVTVFNPAPGGGTSGGQTFTINAAGNPVPTLTSISPNVKIYGDPGFTITCTGTNFVAGSIVRVDGSNRTTTFVNSTSLTATIPSSDLLSLVNRSITVFNPGPGGGTSGAQTLTINLRSFSGTVNLDGWVVSPAGIPITLRFRPVGGGPGSEVHTQVVTLNGASQFTTAVPVAAGNYDIMADGDIWLQRRVVNVNANGSPVTGLIWTLPTGDIDGDGDVTNSDYAIWAANNGASVVPGTNGDLDGDGDVTNADYALWAASNGLSDDL